MEKETQVLVLDPLREFSAYLSQLLPMLGDYKLEICETSLSLVAKATVSGSSLIICGVDSMKQNSKLFGELHQKFPQLKLLLIGDYKPKNLPPAIDFIQRPVRLTDLGDQVKALLETGDQKPERLEYAWLLSIND